ncbi:hypothetical protein JTE90_002132 [Oedothorax gibbosus]|uniref:Uncharacterized protein n=1 Tax=Oedothorax gibbosus TaxID=931172 RepID=A0AAV6V9J8_9ARAC|nr:hypothetical protein JTE90_002132 [Oedothorax gibbosus]
MAKRKFEEFDDEDEPRSETSVLFEEMPMGDVSEACLYDDDDDFMGLVTQIFAENPLPLMYGEGVNVGERASPGFWTGLPVNGPISIDNAVRVVECSRKTNKKYSAEEVDLFAVLDPDQIPYQDRGITLGSTDVVRRLFEVLLDMAVEGLAPHDLVRFILMPTN